MGKGQNDGVKNEEEFAESLNGKTIDSLNPNAQNFVGQLYPDVDNDVVIYAKKEGGKSFKPDVRIHVGDDNDNPVNVSIKKGKNNSIHQERIFQFLDYCCYELRMEEETRNAFLFFQFGDETLDGKGENPLSLTQIKRDHPEVIRIIRDFLFDNRRVLMERFFVYGSNGKEKNIKADYLYHGTIREGVWSPLDETIDYLVDNSKINPKSKSIKIGPLSYQVYSRGKESGKYDISIKWNDGMEDKLREINGLFLKKISSQNENKVLGNNNHGFKNVAEIADAINNCKFESLDGSARNIVKYMFPNVAMTDTVKCVDHKKKNKKYKSDLIITINNVSKSVAIFLGSGNSGQQENFECFVKYCREELDMSEMEENSLKLIFWGDGTINGSGDVEKRLSQKQTKKTYPEDTKIAQTFFDRNRRVLAKRFLVDTTLDGDKSPDYIYYGNAKVGVITSYVHMLDYIGEYTQKSSALIQIGPLTLQMWNRNLNGKSKKKKGRDELQIKFSNIKDHIARAKDKEISCIEKKRIEGINAEYELVAQLNRNRTPSNPLWKHLMDCGVDFDFNSTYAVRVTNKIRTNINKRKVSPKSDVYLIKVDVGVDVLEEGFALDEKTLCDEKINFSPISGSGISCKKPNSSNYTYGKLTNESFVRIFGSCLLGACASVFDDNHEDLILNTDVIKGWKVEVSDFMGFVKKNMGIEKNDFKDLTMDDFKQIKSKSIESIKSMIRNNDTIWKKIFTGEGLFDDPYWAPFIFSHGELKPNKLPESFSVTTGSGRHDGKYTIVVKP